jgi:hypothetical protein
MDLGVASAEGIGSVELVMTHAVVGPNSPMPSTSISHSTESRDFSVDNFVLACFKTNKRERMFVGKVVSIIKNDLVEVTFLRKQENVKNTYFVFPEIEDTAVVSLKQIVHKLKAPRDIRCGRFVFF